MHVALGIFWVLGIGVLAQSAAGLFVTFDFLRYLRRSRSRPLNNFTPPVALIIPCKGLEADFESNVSSYLCQDYPYYQVIFTVASVDDPAYQALRTCLQNVSSNKQNEGAKAIGAQERQPCHGDSKGRENNGVQTALVVAGYSERRGEKVHNLLQGLKAVDAKAEVLVFADSDARPGRDWLRSLVAPLQDAAVTVSTGAGWDLPGPDFVSHLRTAWNAWYVTMLGNHEYNHVAGVSMAVRTTDFKRLGVAERYWANAISDASAMTCAVNEAGGRIRFEPRCVVACRGQAKFGEFIRWGTRQFILIRVYWPGVWWAATVGLVLSFGALLLGLILVALPSIAVGQRLLMAGILLAIILLAISRGLIHMTIAKELFPEEASSLSRYGACYWKASLLVPLVMLINSVASSMTRHMEWRGTYYDLKGRNQTRVIRREK